jgi:hypothetical protein
MNRKALKAEIIKCGTDPEYFIRNYVKIQHPVRGLIPFDLYDYQAELLQDYQDCRFNVVLKARQLGISETTAAYATWMMMFRRDKNIVVIATKKETAKNIIRKVSTAIKNLPPWLMLTKVVTNNVFSIELSNGSRIKAVSTAKDAGRSEAGSLLIIDEAAHIENMADIWTGLRPVVTAGGAVVMLSTPKGVGNTFHKTYVQATKNENDFKHTKLMWWVHPERNADLVDDPVRPGFKTNEWFKKETGGMDAREIAQELECNFNASGDNFISTEYMDWIKDNTILDPVSFQNWDRQLHVWNEPVHMTQYFITADVARGDGNDYSSCHVFDSETMTQCAEYYAKIPPDDFADTLCKIGNNYNGALIVVENNSIGLACLNQIKLLEYENVYYSRKGDFRPGQAFNMLLPLPSITEYVPGFTTSGKSRPLILQKLEEFIRLRIITIRSNRSLEELRKFIWNNGKPQAMKGYNDDLVIALALACWIKETYITPNMMTEGLSKTMLELTGLDHTDHTSIPGATKDPRFVKENERIARQRVKNPYKLTLPDGRVEDLGWLISSK